MIIPLIQLLFLALIFGLVYWVITLLPIPEPFRTIVVVIFALILILLLLGMLFGMVGGPPYLLQLR